MSRFRRWGKVGSVLVSPFPTPSFACIGSPFLGKASPVVELSSETIALITAAGKDYSQLEVVGWLSGTLSGDVDTYLDPDGAEENLKLTIPDYETGDEVTVRGHDFAPNVYGIATSQGGVLPGGARRFMANCPLTGGSSETPFHARLRERAAHDHTDVFIDLDTGMSRIVPEDTLPEDESWDICVKHMRDGWPYIRLNHPKEVSGASLGPVDWAKLRSFSRVKLEHGPAHPGILIIAHGENSPEWNLAVAYAVERIKAIHPEYAHWPIELSYLEDEMIEQDSRNAELGLTGRSISEALARLRGKGVTWVGVIPFMVDNCSGHIEEISRLMGQSVETLTSEWEGVLATGAGASPGFGGILSQKEGALSGEFAVERFDTDVPEMEGGVGGTVDGSGDITLEGTFEGYSVDKTILCEVTLSSMTGKQESGDLVSGDYTGTWVKKQKQGSSWVEVGSGAPSGTWALNRNEEGKPDLSGLEVLLSSAIESHPLMRQIIEARTRELTSGREPGGMGLVLGMHGADLTCCSESWYGMGDAILESVSDVMPFDTTKTAFMSEVADAVSSSVTAHGNGNTALTLHMIAPGSLSRSLPYVIGYPTLQPNVHYLYNQKTLLAFASQESLNLARPPFSLFPSLTAADLAALELDETSDLMVDWLALHSCELVSSYPVGDSWHGEKQADKMLEMTDNVYVLKSNGGADR
jgi:hypothetical protein